MSLTSFLYTLKVWLSAVFVSPLLFITGILITGVFLNMHTTFQITGQTLAGDWDMYKTIVIFGAAFSFPTWLIFLLAIMIAVKSSDSAKRRKLIALIIAGVLAIVTCAAIFYFFGFLLDIGFIYLPLSYCACIIVAAWYYKLEEVVDQPSSEVSMIEH
jgi:hypothetical protein